ncbi:MAG: hypothetical protein ACMUEM_04785 [Flavobacteriales bacterium AspAUS03]
MLILNGTFSYAEDYYLYPQKEVYQVVVLNLVDAYKEIIQSSWLVQDYISFYPEILLEEALAYIRSTKRPYRIQIQETIRHLLTIQGG